MPKENTKEPRVQKEQKEGINPMEALKSMLSPEQKSMLDTYSTLLSSIKQNEIETIKFLIDRKEEKE